MSEQSEVRRQTLQLCQEINEKCQIDSSKFSYDVLRNKNWYIQILSILCPYLADELVAAQHETDQTRAINIILQIINTLDEFNEDVTEAIKGENIVMGDPVQIYYIVQVFAALLEEAIKENQFEEYEEQENQENQEQDSQNFNQPHPYPKQKSDKNSGQKVQNQREEKSGNHSVIGIHHEFEKSESQSDGRDSVFVNNYDNADFPGTKKQNNISHHIMMNNPMNMQQQQSSGQQSEDKYLQHKLCQTKMKKKADKNPEQNQILFGSKKRKKLVEHPKNPKMILKKAKSVEAIQLTGKINQKIRSSHKKKIQLNSQSKNKLNSPVQNTIKKKKRQLEYYNKDFQTHKKHLKKSSSKKVNNWVKTDSNLHKVLNWREQKIKKQQHEYQQSMKMKLETQKELYINKINKLVLELERKKGIQQKKQFREKLIKQNQRAIERIGALQKWYHDRISMIKQSNQKKRKTRNLIETGHRQIIRQIEKNLKKDNEDKLMIMTQNYRKQADYIQNDMEQLQQKIIQVYKAN